MNRRRTHSEYRQMAGRTPVSTVMARFWAFGGIPGVFIVLFFLVMGGWVIALPVAAGWFGVVFVYPLIMRALTNITTDAVAGRNPEYKRWRERGGDPYCDAQGFPVNFNSLATSVTVPDDPDEDAPPPAAYQQIPFTTRACHRGGPHWLPPDTACPRCGSGWDYDARQCPICYTFFDPNTQKYVRFEPDPRDFNLPPYYEVNPPIPVAVPVAATPVDLPDLDEVNRQMTELLGDDPSVHKGRNPS